MKKTFIFSLMCILFLTSCRATAPGAETKQTSLKASELNPDALVKIIRYSDSRKNRRLALFELKKRDMVEEF